MKKIFLTSYRLLLLAGVFVAPVAIPTASAAPRVTVGGSIGIELPRGAISIQVGGDRYHFHDGRYYRKSGRGYTVVRAPRGAVIRDLPHGYAKVVVRGRPYYRYRDVYYERGPRGFVVVDLVLDAKDSQPSPAVVAKDSGYISVWRGDEELRFKDGQFFRNTPKGLVWVETPLGGLSTELPKKVTSIWYKDIEYFESDGVHFRKTPDGYRVVAAPWTDPAENEEAAEQASGSPATS